jgi:hypothetical protein
MRIPQALFLLLIPITACPGPAEDPTISDARGRCRYVNGFNDRPECREYFGSSWTEERMANQCGAPVPGSDPGVLELGLGCTRPVDYLGQCVIDEGTVEASVIVFSGPTCDGLAVGCGFAGGAYEPGPRCGGDIPAPADYQPFIPPSLNCVPPIDGEPPGQGPDGDVCTWEAISASTEEGRHFADYASCDTVRTQRPYWAYDVTVTTDEDDPRLSDPAWVSDYTWLTAQVEASACVCCHSARLAPEGPSGWYLEAGPIWTDSLGDDAIAMLAGWIDSRAFGAYDPADNNGFSRDRTGLPSTDPDRTEAFLASELARRGLSEQDFADSPPFGGPLADQMSYEPGPCELGEGVRADGTVRWVGDRARYVYILEPWAENPHVPPNMDLPVGTLWRLDVPPDEDAIQSGVVYGSVPAGTRQRWPEDGDAPALVPGQTYYIVALFDVAQPLTRCLFEAAE